MMVRIAINGFGRIGRMLVRAGLKEKRLEFVAVNDLTDAKTLAHLLKYDSVHGKLQADVKAAGNDLSINNKRIIVLSEKDPEKLPWAKLKIDIVVESTGLFTKPEDAAKHIKAGAKKVLISAPAKGKPDLTMVRGVNDQDYDKKKHNICSNASCTTNSLAPAVKVLHDNFSIKHGFLTTIHAYTNDQKILDLPHKDLRRARAAAINIIPTTTGAAKSVAEVIPELKGKLDGISMRVPVPNGSVTDFVCEVEKTTTVEAVNKAFKQAALGYMRGIIQYSDEPLVSTDIIGNPHSSIFDSLMTNVVDGNLVKIVTWYDNEWGFSCRMVEVLKEMV
ncbi:type I glyceraldehyde-3-phosphate dehydrogenase [Candidatus Woesearchaeota archaeon]|nr:type I glyceraldehyde-3-phosphate dehydrogenase [Candidatus Woesearchaeota archaeon]